MTTMTGLLLTLVATQLTLTALAADVRVTTEYGVVVGDDVTLNTGEKINSFYAIPFAKSPTGNLRFRPPERPEPWSTPRQAKVPGPVCLQGRGPGLLWLTHPGWDRFSEDCLHLNIFAPSKAAGRPFPVMLWLHGGAYTASGNIQYPGQFMARHDVVVVVANYRLGALGFMSTNDAASPGNYGLMDQIAALEFIRDNIEYFGGDNNKVTLYGQSAGASSSSLLGMISQADDLFHQIIAQSGSDQAFWAINWPESRPETYTSDVARTLGCPTDNTTAMMNCLRTQDGQTIIDTEFNCTMGHFCMGFAPVVDGVLLKDNPVTLRQQGRYRKVPLMIGLTSEDGSFYTAGLVPEADNDYGLTRENFIGVIRRFMEYFTHEYPHRYEDIVRAMDFHYTPWPYLNDTERNRQSMNMLITDAAFGSTGDVMAKSQAEHVNAVYFYILGYRSTNATELLPEWMGVPHNGDLPYVWAFPLLEENPAVRDQCEIEIDVIEWNAEDRQYTHFIQKMWSNFAKTGNPTPSPVDKPLESGSITWPSLTNQNLTYINMYRSVDQRINYRQKSMAFMREYVPYVFPELENPPTAPTTTPAVPAETCAPCVCPENNFIWRDLAMPHT